MAVRRNGECRPMIWARHLRSQAPRDCRPCCCHCTLQHWEQVNKKQKRNTSEFLLSVRTKFIFHQMCHIRNHSMKLLAGISWKLSSIKPFFSASACITSISLIPHSLFLRLKSLSNCNMMCQYIVFHYINQAIDDRNTSSLLSLVNCPFRLNAP